MTMLVFLGVVLAAAFFVTERNDVTERLAFDLTDISRDRQKWRQPVNVVGFGAIAFIGIAMMIVLPHSFDLLDVVIAIMFSWSAFSILWAPDRLVTARSLGCWLCTGCAVFGVGLTCSLSECAIIAAAGCIFYLVAGVVYEIYKSGLSIFSRQRFYGCVGCNRQAAEALLLIYLTVFFYQSGTLSLAAASAIVVFAMGIVIMTRSRTGIWAATVGSLTWALVGLPTTSGKIVLLLCSLLGICLVAWIPSVRNKTASLFLLGRNRNELKTLSGRTFLWSGLLPLVRRRPICGHGYGSIWTDPRLFNLQMEHSFYIRLTHAHSVYLDSLLNGGIIGLSLFLASVGIAGYNTILMEPPAGPFIIGLLTYSVIHGFCESTLALPLHRAFTFFAILVAIPS